MASTVFITGCSSGIGAAAVRHFAAQGWNVAATLRQPAAASFEQGTGQVAAFARAGASLVLVGLHQAELHLGRDRGGLGNQAFQSGFGGVELAGQVFRFGKVGEQ